MGIITTFSFQGSPQSFHKEMICNVQQKITPSSEFRKIHDANFVVNNNKVGIITTLNLQGSPHLMSFHKEIIHNAQQKITPAGEFRKIHLPHAGRNLPASQAEN